MEPILLDIIEGYGIWSFPCTLKPSPTATPGPRCSFEKAGAKAVGVRKRTLANLTDWPAEKVQCLRRVLKGQRLVRPEDAFTIERSLPHQGEIAKN